jgi:membrane protein DedA with SNARE-associated domain
MASFEELLTTITTHLPYGGPALMLLAAGFGLPIPEDIPLLLGGYLCYKSKAQLGIMLPLLFVCVLTGDVTLFTLGKRWGDRILEHRWTRRLFRKRRLDAIKMKFHEHGAKIIFAGRFMPGMRSVIFATAGILDIPYWKFALTNGSAALISVPTLVVLGWYFGGQFDWVVDRVREGQLVIIAIVVVVAAAVILLEVRVHRRRRAREAALEVAPASADVQVPAVRGAPVPTREPADVP